MHPQITSDREGIGTITITTTIAGAAAGAVASSIASTMARHGRPTGRDVHAVITLYHRLLRKPSLTAVNE